MKVNRTCEGAFPGFGCSHPEPFFIDIPVLKDREAIPQPRCTNTPPARGGLKRY